MTQLTFNLIVGTLLRSALMVLAGWLVAHGMLPQGSVDEWAGALALVILGVSWSLYQKAISNARLKAALELPAGSTMDDVKDKVATDRALAAILMVLLFVPGLQACANKHVAVQVDQSIVALTAGFQDAELALHHQGVISEDTHGVISLRFGDVWRLAGQYNALVRDWPGKGAPPAALVPVARDIARAVKEIMQMLPTDPAVVGQANKILDVLNQVLSWAGGVA